jgi:hypothetical protein
MKRDPCLARLPESRNFCRGERAFCSIAKKLAGDFNGLSPIAELCINWKLSIYRSGSLSRQLRKSPVTDCLKLGQFASSALSRLIQ